MALFFVYVFYTSVCVCALTPCYAVVVKSKLSDKPSVSISWSIDVMFKLSDQQDVNLKLTLHLKNFDSGFVQK